MARWANEGDGHYQYDRPSEPDDENQHLSRMTRLGMSTEGRISRPGQWLEDLEQAPRRRPISQTRTKSVRRRADATAAPADPATSEQRGIRDRSDLFIGLTSTTPAANHVIPSHQTESPIMAPSYHPFLYKALVPIYKGRTLKEITSDGEARFIDQAAVFVGRLVKTVESKETLFRRFRRYGRIVNYLVFTKRMLILRPQCDIEYNPQSASSTYATARILYQAPDAAQRAMHSEVCTILQP